MRTNYTKKIHDLLVNVNYLLNRSVDTFKIAKRNSFTYIEYVKTGNTIFNNATTNKELYIALYSFRDGLYMQIDK